MRCSNIKTQILGCLVALTVAWPASSWAQSSEEAGQGLSLTRIEVARGVEDREPLQTEGPFVADGERLYVWLQFENHGDVQEVTVNWHDVNRNRQSTQTVEVGHSRRWRTWVYRTMTARRAGSWRAEVVGPDGQVLGGIDFTVVAPEAGSEASASNG